MEDSMVSRAFTIIEAVRLTADGDIPALRQLLLSNVLKTDHVLRILLTFLPEGTDPENYIGLLKDLFKDPSNLSPDFSRYPRLDMSDEDACNRVRRLRLKPLALPQYHVESKDPLTLFLIHQAFTIDADTGSLTLAAQLLEPFVDRTEALRTWMITTLLPLLRMDYEYYPQSNVSISLDKLQRMDEQIAIQTLLSRAAQKNTSEQRVELGRDLRGLVGPWMYGESSRKRRKLDHGRERMGSISLTELPHNSKLAEENEDGAWAFVNEWICDLGMRDFPRAVDAFAQWDGPRDVDYGDWGEASLEPASPDSLSKDYAQAGLAVVYGTNQASMETMIGSHRILLKVARLMGLDEPPDLKRSDTPAPSGISQELFGSLSQPHLLHNALLRTHNPLTVPTDQSVALFNLLLSSNYKLLNLGNIRSTRDVAHLCLFGTEQDQSGELRRTLHRLKTEKMDEKVWSSIRHQVLWLQDWEKQPGQGTAEPRGVFSKVAKFDLENELLRAMLDGGCYTLAVDVYCKTGDAPLPPEKVENTILNAAMGSYDAASNGNRTRGGVRKASEIISTFRGYFPSSEGFAQTSALLSATHAMSFYSLSLQHGVPFQPVNIRAHKDPMSLIGKILDQNPRSYTHLDDLLEIGQNLVAAGLSQPQQGSRLRPAAEDRSLERATNARWRITRMAIEAALAEDDFDTAYSYVVNRLSLAENSNESVSATSRDDISWRAAYAAGRYPTSNSGGSALRRLEQRMELLSQALLLAPSPALSEILHVWQQCEQQMIELIANDTAEEDDWDKRGDHRVPGGFGAEESQFMQKARDPSRSAIQEEAPMGLFEVARGAASALSKNAFPLRGPQKHGSTARSKPRPVSTSSLEGSGSDGGSGEGSGRVRKRDMVSSMVTGGLASGIGWVIGAPPVRQE